MFFGQGVCYSVGRYVLRPGFVFIMSVCYLARLCVTMSISLFFGQVRLRVIRSISLFFGQVRLRVIMSVGMFFGQIRLRVIMSVGMFLARLDYVLLCR